MERIPQPKSIPLLTVLGIGLELLEKKGSTQSMSTSGKL